MNIFQAVILGLVEGATEYLPVSSTFHLIWTAKILGLAQNDFQKAFEVIIQGGAILAVLWVYFPVWRKKKDLIPLILASFVPTAVIGLLLYKVIKNIFFENILLQLAVFILVGFAFIIFEKISKHNLSRKAVHLSFKEALLIGLIQSFAVIPGVSRAGAVILAMMFLKVKREEAAEYSFLLALPTLIAASGLDLVKSAPYLIAHPSEVGVLLVGLAAAFVSAVFAVKWLIIYLQKHTLTTFGIYRIILSIILIVLFLWR